MSNGDLMKPVIGAALSVFGLISLYIVVMLLVSVLGFISELFTGDKCATYKSQIEQANVEISGLRQLNQNITSNLQQCVTEYNRLITENVTKKDIEDIKQTLSITENHLTVLNQKFDLIQNNYVAMYSSLQYNYNISLAFNLVLTFLSFSLLSELFGFSLFGLNIKARIEKYKAKHKPKDKEHKEKEHHG